MKTLASFSIIFLFTLTSIFSQTQTCDCKEDLDFLVEKIKKMPSYKKQIKGQASDQFEHTYAKLSAKMEQPIAIEECYKMLIEQLSLVNDGHASISLNAVYLSEDDSKDDEKLAHFKASDRFKNHPKTNRNLSELQEELSKKSVDDKEGIYDYYSGKQQIGIYYADNQKDFIGVVLESDLNQWESGEIKFYARYTNGNKYDVYYYDGITRTPKHIKSISFENGRLLSYKKVGNIYDYEFREKDKPELEFKQLNESVQYIYFGNFSNRKKTAHQTFYNEVAQQLTANTVIVDLRSNSGGNKKFSDRYLKLLKNKKVYILTNCYTASNGEQFTVKLKKLKNGMHLGQTSFGVIAYGTNYGKSYDTPSGYFRISPTDMNFHEFYKYEGRGISPDITLDFDSDWIEQTLAIIADDTNK